MLRASRYHIRVRVPVSLVPILGRREVRCSLRTDNYREALVRGLPIVDYLTARFEELRRDRVTEASIATITTRFGEHLNNTPTPAQQAAILANLSPEEIDQAAEQYRTLADIDHQAIRYGRYGHIEKALDRFAAKEGLVIDKSSGNYPLLLQQALMVRRDAFMYKYDCARGERPYLPALRMETAPVPCLAPVTVEALPIQSDKTVSDLVDMFIQEKSEVDEKWTDNSRDEVKRSLDLFTAIVGADLPLSSLSRPLLKEYKQNLALLPADRTKKKEYRDKTIKELIARPVAKKDRLALKTRNDQMIWVNALMDWAETEELIPRNYARKLTLSRRTLDKHMRDECDPYSDDEVRNILHGLTYDPNRPERFWCPITAPHAGIRQNEVAQLLLRDIKKINGILCFKLIVEDKEKEDKKLKTKASRRNVPVHPLLLELGFEEYVEGLRKAGETRLFPKLSKSKRGYGVELGKWYGRTITKVLFPDQARLKVFNSFRHSCDDKLKNMPDLRDSMQLYLMGHATGKLAYDRYGTDIMAPVLFDVIKRIDYGLDVERLKEIMANPVFTHRGPKKRSTKSDEQKGDKIAGQKKMAAI